MPINQIAALNQHLAGRACHGCWYYFGIATKQLQQSGPTEDQILLEGEPWQETHFKNQLQSVALLYGVSPEDITKHWECVEKQADALGIQRPDARIQQKTRIVIQ